MKLIDALTILRRDLRTSAPAMQVQLCVGFQPLHLQTFLDAELRSAVPERRPQFEVGIYGDFWGNLELLDQSETESGIVVIEWGDLEPRLALRNLGSWSPSVLLEVVEQVRSRTAQLVAVLERASRSKPVVLSLPTLRFPPIDFQSPWQVGTVELQLRSLLADLAQQVTSFGVRVVSPSTLEALSPVTDRLDIKSELNTGFPYTLTHVSVLAHALVRLLHPPAARKGIITDLDNTLWSGIVGEAGAENVSWDLEHGTHIHGVYQRLLHALADSGVLVAVASKNDPVLAEQALKRNDILIPRESIFPMEASWGAKSDAIDRILSTWNIGPESVVFIDDSPMELAEVTARHPDVECIQFSADPKSVLELCSCLRDRFGKVTLSEEDRIRAESIRSARSSHNAGILPISGTPEQFLEQSEAEITFSFEKEPFDERAFELINKTNQFNLNGRRVVEGEWRGYLKESSTILAVGSYRDKYGPLGKIMVLSAREHNTSLVIDSWVLSCRAFSRRIEYAVIAELFKKTEAKELTFDFQQTPKNKVIRDFLREMLGTEPEPNCRLRREDFFRVAPKMFHRILEATARG